MCESKIALEKIRAYRATDYRLGHTDKDIVLAVGLRSCQLAQLFATKGVNCGAFLTAYNPRGSQQTDSQNELAHAKLAAKLKNRQHHQRGLHAHHGAVTRVHALHLAGHQPVAYVI